MANIPPHLKVPCFECRELTTGRHHVVPVSRGGKRTLPLCPVCHAKTHNMSQGQLIREGLKRSEFAGRQKIKTDNKKLKAMRQKGMRYKDIAEATGLSVGTVYNRVHE